VIRYPSERTTALAMIVGPGRSVPKEYAAGLEIYCPGGACTKLGHAIPSNAELARPMPDGCDAALRRGALPANSNAKPLAEAIASQGYRVETVNKHGTQASHAPLRTQLRLR
jgi:hypothetical protein